jgi:hypothetical protein
LFEESKGNVNLKRLYFLLICFCCIAQFGCEKHPFDYRNKYLGNYNFTVHETEWTYSLGTTLDTTYAYIGEVSYGSDENTVSISYTENYSATTVVNEDGSLKCYSGTGSIGFCGEFESKSTVAFDYSYGGLGGGATFNVYGEKCK